MDAITAGLYATGFYANPFFCDAYWGDGPLGPIHLDFDAVILVGDDDDALEVDASLVILVG